MAMDNSHFVMYLGPICNATPKVTLEIEANGELTIGDGAGRTGSVLVQNGHEIVIEETGIVRIKKGSTLKLNEGGILRIKDGGKLIIEDGGSIITEYGSIIHYENGAEAQLNGEDSRMILGGDLHLFENADFRPIHDGVNSGIIVINNPDGLIIGENGSKFRIIGDGDDDPMLTINEGAKLIAPINMSQLLFASCNVTFRSDEDYSVQSFAPFSSVNSSYAAQDNLTLSDIHPRIGLFNKSSINSSSFTDVLLYSEESGVYDGILTHINNSDFSFTYAKESHLIELFGGNLFMLNCDFTNFTGQALHLEDLTSFSQIINSDFTAETSDYGIGIFKSANNELLVKNCNFENGAFGIYNTFGEVSVSCNDFTEISNAAIFGGTYSRVEMSTLHKVGYNTFTDITGNNVFLQNANQFSIVNGYNYFWKDENDALTVKGTLNIPTPFFYIPGVKNRWNIANSVPGSDQFFITSIPTGTQIHYSLGSNTSANCGALDPETPPVVPVGTGSGSYMPIITITGQTNAMRLDSAISFANGNTHYWDDQNYDSQAIQYYKDILTYAYSSTQLNDERIQYFLREAYNDMRFVVGHAISDSTILRSDNQNSFDSTIQKYVDVLNVLTVKDTFSIDEYRQRFSFELDKAHLFRMLGHTATGLDILQNMNSCDLDSAEQVVLNHWMFVYEEQLAKQSIGIEAYGKDTIYTDTSGYKTPMASQATEFTFGSVINSLTSINYRSCSGSLKPEEDETNRKSLFAIYPNPSDGIVNLKYQIPTEKRAELVVYSINGQVIYRTWLNEASNTATIDLSNVESGLYLYTVMIDGAVEHAGRISIAK